MDPVTLELLMSELQITEQEVYRLPAPLDLSGLFEVTKIDRPALKFPRHVPTTSVHLLPTEAGEKPDVFASIARGDILLHHPYESFATSVQSFLEQAATDPNVLAIKQTLYRTSGDSPSSRPSSMPPPRGKAVLALVEIKARFDEQGEHRLGPQARARRRARRLRPRRAQDPQQARARHPAGGRQARPLQPRRHGQLHPKTSRIYEDFGLLTADETVGKDLTACSTNSPATRSRRSSSASSSPRATSARACSSTSPPRRTARAPASRAAFASRSTRWSTRPSLTRSIGRARRGSRSTSGCAASARSAPGFRA